MSAWDVKYTYDSPPGGCLVCGRTTSPFIETDEWTESGDRVQICTDCISRWAKPLGLLGVEERVVEIHRDPNDAEVGRYIAQHFSIISDGMRTAVLETEKSGAVDPPVAVESPIQEEHECGGCGRIFGSRQAYAAHFRHCKGPR